MKKHQTFIFLASFLFLVSCFNNNNNNNNQRVIASVNKKDLLLSEVTKAIPEYTEDSTFFIDRYIIIFF